MSDIVVITDTSVLINFLVLDRTELLARLPNHRFVVTVESDTAMINLDYYDSDVDDRFPSSAVIRERFCESRS